MNEYQVVRFFIANGVFNSTPTENYAETLVLRESNCPQHRLSQRLCVYNYVVRSWCSDNASMSTSDSVAFSADSVTSGKHKAITAFYEAQTRGQSNLTKSASRGPIPRLGVTPGGRKLYR